MSFYISHGDARLYCTVAPEVASKIDFPIRTGSFVRIDAKLRVYEKKAQIEIIVDSIESSDQGDFHKKLDKLFKELEAEGLLSQAGIRKVVTDPPPDRIAIVAPKNSRAIKDIKTAFESEGKNLDITDTVIELDEQTPQALISAIEKCGPD